MYTEGHQSRVVRTGQPFGRLARLKGARCRSRTRVCAVVSGTRETQ